MDGNFLIGIYIISFHTHLQAKCPCEQQIILLKILSLLLL